MTKDERTYQDKRTRLERAFLMAYRASLCAESPKARVVRTGTALDAITELLDMARLMHDHTRIRVYCHYLADALCVDDTQDPWNVEEKE